LFSRTFLHLEEFTHNGRHGAFRAWLRRLAISEIGDHFGDEQVGLPHQQAIATPRVDDAPDSDDDSELTILSHQAWGLVRTEFSDRDQNVFRRVRINGEAPRDVADDMGLSTNNVYQIIFRITKRLRERFAGEID
jgi:RNA polymerase sigma factor (sigma-70 family)